MIRVETSNSRLRIMVEMKLNDFGNPMPPLVKKAIINAHIAHGLDISQSDDGKPFDYIHIDANRRGLLLMAVQSLALAYAAPDAEDKRLHKHLDCYYSPEHPGVAEVVLHVASMVDGSGR